MPYPTKYTRQYDFQSYQVSNPTRPLPGNQVNIDLNAVKQSVGEIVDFLKGPIRADGKLANGSVGIDQLNPNLNLGFSLPTTWEPGVDYTIDSTVLHANKFWKANVAHTSTDGFDESKWTEIVDFGAQATAAAASAASTAADRVQTGADAAATAADRVQTGADAAATASDRTATAADAAATAADRVATGTDSANAQTARDVAEAARVSAEASAASLTPEMVAKLNVYSAIADASAAYIDSLITEIHTENRVGADGLRRTWYYSATEPTGVLGFNKLQSANGRWFKSTAQIVAVLATAQSNGEGLLYTWAPPSNLWSYDLRSPTILGLTASTGWEQARTTFISSPLSEYAEVARANPGTDYAVINISWGGLAIERWIGLDYVYSATINTDPGTVSFINGTTIFIHERDAAGSLRLQTQSMQVAPTYILISKSTSPSTDWRKYQFSVPLALDGVHIYEGAATLVGSAGTINDGDAVKVMFTPNNHDRLASEARPALDAIGKSVADSMWFWQGESDSADDPQALWPIYYDTMEQMLYAEGYTGYKPSTLIHAVKDARVDGADPWANFNRQIFEAVRRSPSNRTLVDTPMIVPASAWNGVHLFGLGSDILGKIAGRQNLDGSGSRPGIPFEHPHASIDNNGVDISGLTAGALNSVLLTFARRDTHGWWDSVNKRFIGRRAGKYHIDYCVTAVATSAGAESVKAAVSMNGTVVSEGSTIEGPSNIFRARSVGSLTVPMNGTTDYVALLAFMPTGWTVIEGDPKGTYFQITYLGE
jgi:hypothetical protein